jgi:hypothetical protein
MKKNAFRFQVKVVEYAIQGNHLHMLVRAQSREGLQNFFRVVAGHSAQKILQKFPLQDKAGGAPSSGGVGAPSKSRDRGAGGAQAERKEQGQSGCAKNRRKFWSFLLYSRVVSWGRDFSAVVSYIQKNTLELLQLIAYKPRGRTNSGVKHIDRAGKELKVLEFAGSKT